MAVAQTGTEVEADMRETLGLFPNFFGYIPDELLEHVGNLQAPRTQ